MVLVGHYDTVPAQDNVPGRIADGAVHGCGATDMKGGVAVALELVRDLARGEPGRRRRRAAPLRQEELPAQFSPLPELFDRSQLVRATPTSRSCSSRPTCTIQAGCLGNLNAHVDLPRRQRPLGAPLARRERDREGDRRTGSDRRSRAARGDRRRAAVLRGGIDHAASRRASPTTSSRTAPSRRSTSATRPTGRRESAAAYLRSLAPAGAEVEITRRLAARRASSPTPRSCGRCGDAGDLRVRAEAGVDERRRLHDPRHRRRQLRARRHPLRPPSRRARRDRRRSSRLRDAALASCRP